MSGHTEKAGVCCILSTYSRPYQLSLLFRLNEWFARALQVSFFITDCLHVGLVGEAVPRCGVFYHLSGHAPKGDRKSVLRQAAHCQATLGWDSGFRPLSDCSLMAPLSPTGRSEINVMVHRSLCAS